MLNPGRWMPSAVQGDSWQADAKRPNVQVEGKDSKGRLMRQLASSFLAGPYNDIFSSSKIPSLHMDITCYITNYCPRIWIVKNP